MLFFFINIWCQNRCSSPHLPLYPPLPSIVSEEENRAASPVNDWEGNSHSHLEGCVIVYCNNKTEELHDEVLEIFFAGNTKETVSP